MSRSFILFIRTKGIRDEIDYRLDLIHFVVLLVRYYNVFVFVTVKVLIQPFNRNSTNYFSVLVGSKTLKTAKEHYSAAAVSGNSDSV